MNDLKLCLDIREVLETGSIHCYLMRKEEGGSGTNPEPLSDAETILEQIQFRNKLCQQRLTWLQQRPKKVNSRKKVVEEKLWL